MWNQGSRPIAFNDLPWKTHVVGASGPLGPGRRVGDHADSTVADRLSVASARLVSVVNQSASFVEVCTAVVDEARLIVSATTAVLTLFDTATEAMVAVAASGAYADRLVGMHMPLDRCLSGSVFQNALAESVASAVGDHRVWAPAVRAGHVGVALVVPLGRERTAVGVLNLHRGPEAPAFTADDAISVEHFAESAALVVLAARQVFGDSAGQPVIDLSTRDVLDARPLLDISEGRLRGAIESAPDGMMMVDDDGTILMVNRQIESMFGYERAELLGRSVEVLLPERFRSMHAAHRLRYRADPKVRVMGAGLELAGCRRDGTEFPVEISLSPIVDAEGSSVVASIRDVSDRAAAQVVQDRVHAAINATRDGLFIFSADTFRFMYVNDGGTAQTGYSAAELLAMTPMHVVPEFIREGVADLIEPLLNGSVEQVSLRTVLRPRSGIEFPIDVMLNYPPTFGASGERLIVAVVRDIAMLVETENELRESEEAFRLAFDDAPIGMLVVELDAGRTVLQSNAALGRLLGRPESIVGLDLADLIHPDDRAIIEQSAADLERSHVPEHALEIRYLHADGSPVWAHMHAKTLRSGETAQVLVQVIDIGDRKAAEVGERRQRLAGEGLAAVEAGVLSEDFDEPEPTLKRLLLICSHARHIAEGTFVALGRLNNSNIVWLASDGTEAGFLTANPMPIELTQFETHVAFELDSQEPNVFTLVIAVPSADSWRALLVQRDRPFDEETQTSLKSFAFNVATAVAAARNRRDRERLTVLEDRERIARDLHDTVIQDLFGIGMQISASLGLVRDEETRGRFRAQVDAIDESIRRLRVAVFGLHHANLVQPSNRAELSSVITDASRALGHHPDVEIIGEVEHIEGIVIEHLVPTLREALSNIARHAQATTSVVTVTITDDTITLDVEDDGVGLASTATPGEGTRNFTARAATLYGTARLSRRPQGGTLLHWSVPHHRRDR
jgi:PAS domain S-box-containing protein